jgi:hypothetical protein
MKTKTLMSTLLLVTIFSFLGFSYFHQPRETSIAKIPSITGTYKFISRTLPDGTIIKPPMANGIQTFTKNERNFNVMWTDKDGKHFSYSVYSTYKLTDKDYTESIIFGIMNDEISGKGLTYITDQTKTVPVTFDGENLSFKLPFDPPAVTFKDNKMIATAEEMFTDYWEKIK